ncbi:hypothetical protein IFR05_011825, partial [Cadophora sp. M221]
MMIPKILAFASILLGTAVNSAALPNADPNVNIVVNMITKTPSTVDHDIHTLCKANG